MSDVKRKISEDRGVDPSGQILISSGKTLKDEDSLSDSVSASGFLVLMMKVSKAATPFILYMQFKRGINTYIYIYIYNIPPPIDTNACIDSYNSWVVR